MNPNLDIYFNIDTFFLAIIIISSIVLCIFACFMVWYKSTKPRLKHAFAYMGIIILLYQGSTLLALYSPPKFFPILLDIKIVFAFLLKSVFLYYIAVFIEDNKLEKIFLWLHIGSFSIVFLYLFYQPYKNSIVNMTGTNLAQYGEGARIYTIISSLIYVAAGVAFILSYKPFRQKRNLMFLFLVILSNVGLLSLFTFGVKDVLHEKVHVVIFMAFLAFFLKSTPFLQRKDKLLSMVNIIDGIDETVVILDKHNNVGYIHNSFDNINIDEYIEEIKKLIYQDNEEILKSNTKKEGEIELPFYSSIYVHYSVSPLFFKGKYIGRIIVLRDITSYTQLQHSLNEKNQLLKEAIIKQQEYRHVASALVAEEERARILDIVNNIAGEYLREIRDQTTQLKTLDFKNNEIAKEKIKAKNEEMLTKTRNAIDEIRQAVKKLNTVK